MTKETLQDLNKEELIELILLLQQSIEDLEKEIQTKDLTIQNVFNETPKKGKIVRLEPKKKE